MQPIDRNNTASGYLVDVFEGIDTRFTDLELLHTSDTHLVTRAKRYGRWWILKTLRPERAAEAAFRQRLRKEFELLVQVQHPAVVGAVGLEEVEGLGRCIVMEYIDGQTLDRWLQGAPPRRERMRIARALADAVAGIHAHGIVHRDLKPANILITNNGQQLKLIDFGLADTASHAVLKQPAGTPGYLAPEQASAAVADVRNDLYSLGVILGELDLGCPRIVRRCLLPADRRYQRIDQLQAALRARAERPKRMRRLLAGLIAGVLVAAVAVQTGRLRTVQEQTTTIETARQRIDDAIQTGIARFDEKLAASALVELLDTLTCLQWLPSDYNDRYQSLCRSIPEYVYSLAGDFTDSEQAEILQTIFLHSDRILRDRLERMMNLPYFPEE